MNRNDRLYALVEELRAVAVTAEVPALWPLRREDLDIPYGVLRQLALA